jgi:hypothetical protein
VLVRVGVSVNRVVGVGVEVPQRVPCWHVGVAVGVSVEHPTAPQDVAVGVGVDVEVPQRVPGWHVGVAVGVSVEHPTAPQDVAVVALGVTQRVPAWHVGVAVAVVCCTCWHCENSDVLPAESVAVVVRKEPAGAGVGNV